MLDTSKCKPLTHREFIQDELGSKYAPLASFDVDGQMWHIVGADTDFVVMVPNMVDAGIYRGHKAHEDMPAEIAAQLVTINAQPQTPRELNRRVSATLQREIDARNAPAKTQSGGKGSSNPKPPADTQAGGQSDDAKGPSTSQQPQTGASTSTTGSVGDASADDKGKDA